MSGNERAYAIGVSLIVVGLSATVETKPRAGVQSGFLRIQAGGGTLAIVNGASAISTSGFLVPAATDVELQGPAKFYLAAAGATMTVAFVQRMSAGATIG